MTSAPRDLRHLVGVLDALPDAVVVTDRDGVLRYLNGSARELLSWGDADATEGEPFALPSVHGGIGELNLVDVTGNPLILEIHVAELHVDDEAWNVATMRDVTDRRVQERQARDAALLDPLTGLSNRVLLMDRIDQLIAGRARESQRAFALLLTDLDGFKQINDTHGHAVGDELLIAIASRLRRRFRPADTIARLGGDEFAILLPDVVDPAGCARAARRVLRINEATIQVGNADIMVRSSIGIVLWTPGVPDAAELLSRADGALYAAKDQGRGTYRLYDEVLHTESARRLALEEGLRRAVESGDLSLSFEPMIDLDTGRIAGGEAVVQWRPDGGPDAMPREELRTLASDVGLMSAIDLWAVEESMRLLGDRADSSEVFLTVNLGALQRVDEEAAEELLRLVEGWDAPKGVLMVEIAESALVGDDDRAQRVLNRLADRGIHVIVDRFGAGFSSVRRLARLPIAGVKLDHEVVTAADWDSVRALVGLAGSLGLQVFADGVDTEGARMRLAGLGVALGQGQLAPPLTADELFRSSPARS